MDANNEAARRGDHMSESAGTTTTGGINPIHPQPKKIPGGLGKTWLTVAIVAAIIAIIYFVMTMGGDKAVGQ